jgi:hypothetical protein
VESWLFEFDRSWHAGQLAEQVRKLPPGSPLRIVALVELVKIDLERQWQQGRPACVEGYLRAYPELGTADTVPTDLIAKEYEVRRQSGAAPQLTTFVKRFPQQAERLRRLLGQVKQSSTGPRPGLKGKETVRLNSPLADTTTGPGGTGSLPERFGRYVIRKRLGQGGMGTVYLAHDTELDRDVALKVPHVTAADGPEVLKRFHREARAAATLQHPYICPIHDVGQVDNVPYLTMAYIEGHPLSKIIARGKPLSQRNVAELVRKLALGLQEAHRKRIVHRDLKPSNIMINKRGEPVVMDFGLVLRLGKTDARLTRSGIVMGSAAYMPPEQVRGATAEMGPACDVYSLGAVLYELLSGRLPFEGSYLAVCAQVLSEEPPPPSTHRPGVEPQLEAICRKAMAKRPEDRYATMGKLAAAVAAYLRPATAAVAEAAPPRRLLPRFWVMASGAAALLLICAGFYFYFKYKSASGDTVEVAFGNTDRAVPPVSTGKANTTARVAPAKAEEKQAEPAKEKQPVATAKEKPAVCVVSSWFKEGNDGWSTKNEDGSTDATTPVEVKQFEGFDYLSATDVNRDHEWGWHAPAKYHGDHSDKFGRLLKYSIWTSRVGDVARTDWWVCIRGGGDTLFVDGSFQRNPVAGKSEDYSVRLNTSGGWKKWISPTEQRPATDEDIKRVLANVSDLRFKGDFCPGAEGHLHWVIFGADE